MRFKSNWASLIVGSKFTIFALFYFVFAGNFPSTSPRGAYTWRGNLTEGFLRYWIGGPILGGAYTWRGLFSEFYGIRLRYTPPTQHPSLSWNQSKPKCNGSTTNVTVHVLCHKINNLFSVGCKPSYSKEPKNATSFN